MLCRDIELNIVDYLLKPFSFQRFLKAVTKIETNAFSLPIKKITESKNSRSRDSIFVKSGHEHIKIALKDILLIKSESDYTEIYTDSKKYLTNHTLKIWKDTLLSAVFCQIHKSYIINTDKVSKVSANQIYINDHVIPIGRAFKHHFYENYLNRLS